MLLIKAHFPETLPTVRPIINITSIPDPLWLAGFAEGESCFFIRVYKSAKSKQGSAVQLALITTQHSRDKELLNTIAQFLECGRVEVRSNGCACDFIVNSIKDFRNKIIPYFSKYPLLGTKSLNFHDFVKVFDLMNTKKHLTLLPSLRSFFFPLEKRAGGGCFAAEEGLATIINIKSGHR